MQLRWSWLLLHALLSGGTAAVTTSGAQRRRSVLDLVAAGAHSTAAIAELVGVTPRRVRQILAG